jgi:SPP1 gp7 family putative phage head morphogenesis protein
VYNGKIGIGDIDAKLLKHIGSALENQVIAGFGKSFANVDFTTPDAAMLTRLTRDVWHFSAAKNYQQLRDMTLALKDENGKLRKFEDFREIALNDDEKYRKWLKTEWNQAAGGSVMAARWTEFQQNADIMPYLKYDTVGDENVRNEHAALDGIVRKIVDEFWKKYFPPNGWGCRCSADQLSTSYAKETDQVPEIKIPKMFQTNLADSGLIFPEDHPYYIGTPAKILRQSVQTLPDSVAYKDVYTSETGNVKMHFLHGIDEMNDNIEMSKRLADNGYKVRLLPVLDDDKIRKAVYKTDTFISGKNPDALLNKTLFEFKKLSSVNYKNIQRNIYRASKQAENIFISINQELSLKDIERPVNGLFSQSKTIKQVWIDNNGNIIKMQNPNYEK